MLTFSSSRGADDKTYAHTFSLEPPLVPYRQSEPMTKHMVEFVTALQAKLVAEFEAVEGPCGRRFIHDQWTRPKANEGYGVSCVLQEGRVFEKVGVNISVIQSTLPPSAVRAMRRAPPTEDQKCEYAPTGAEKSLEEGGTPFFAAGLSLVAHPHNPHAPTAHMNLRYFETINDAWFGGGADLTPCYLYAADAVAFHTALRRACNSIDQTYYKLFSLWCDKYFWLPHRGESRGIGGIFFDDLRPEDSKGIGRSHSAGELFGFLQRVGNAFSGAYMPIVLHREIMPFTSAQKRWQAVRRGRYVEFNLLFDRGTRFGIETPDARIESVLVSMPLNARWEYVYEPEVGTPEATLLDTLRSPRIWVSQDFDSQST